jgi:hypothetical protein
VEVERKGARAVDSHNLPVHLAVVDHAEHSEHADLDDLAHSERLVAELDEVERVVVAGAVDDLVNVRGVLPRAREGAVVDHRVKVVEARGAVLVAVLPERVVRRPGVDFHLGARAARARWRESVAVSESRIPQPADRKLTLWESQ